MFACVKFKFNLEVIILLVVNSNVAMLILFLYIKCLFACSWGSWGLTIALFLEISLALIHELVYQLSLKQIGFHMDPERYFHFNEK